MLKSLRLCLTVLCLVSPATLIAADDAKKPIPGPADTRKAIVTKLMTCISNDDQNARAALMAIEPAP